MDKKDLNEDTWLVHAGRDPDAYYGIVNPPIARASTILYPNLAAFENPDHKYRYARYGTPLTDLFESTMAKLENGYGSVSSSCGLMAITSAILSFVKSGDHILVSDTLYGPTYKFFTEEITKFGIDVEFFKQGDEKNIENKFRNNTSCIYIESPGSSVFDIIDIPAITEKARAKNIVTICDNSWGSGVLLKPLNLGADVSCISCTKYISGHADSFLGVSIARTKEIFEKLQHGCRAIGVCPSPDNISLALRGLRTLKMRMKRNEEAAIRVIDALQGVSGIKAFHAPHLPSHKQHNIWKRDFHGTNGLFAITLEEGSHAALTAFIDGLKLFPLGDSWGGYESLILPQYPATTRYDNWDEKNTTLRIHVGFEDPDDLISDLKAGLKRYAA